MAWRRSEIQKTCVCVCFEVERGKQCSYHQNLKCPSRNLCPLQELQGYLKIICWFLLLVTISSSVHVKCKTLSICFFWGGGLPLFSGFSSPFFCIFSETLFLACWWWQCAPMEEGFYEHLGVIYAASFQMAQNPGHWHKVFSERKWFHSFQLFW